MINQSRQVTGPATFPPAPRPVLVCDIDAPDRPARTLPRTAHTSGRDGNFVCAFVVSSRFPFRRHNGQRSPWNADQVRGQAVHRFLVRRALVDTFAVDPNFKPGRVAGLFRHAHRDALTGNISELVALCFHASFRPLVEDMVSEAGIGGRSGIPLPGGLCSSGGSGGRRVSSWSSGNA